MSKPPQMHHRLHACDQVLRHIAGTHDVRLGGQIVGDKLLGFKRALHHMFRS